jgi:hypothetical protein
MDLSPVSGDAGSVLMYADNRRVDHLYGCIMWGGQPLHEGVQPQPAIRNNLRSWPRAAAEVKSRERSKNLHSTALLDGMRDGAPGWQ